MYSVARSNAQLEATKQKQNETRKKSKSPGKNAFTQKSNACEYGFLVDSSQKN